MFQKLMFTGKERQRYKTFLETVGDICPFLSVNKGETVYGFSIEVNTVLIQHNANLKHTTCNEGRVSIAGSVDHLSYGKTHMRRIDVLSFFGKCQQIFSSILRTLDLMRSSFHTVASQSLGRTYKLWVGTREPSFRGSK